MNNTPRMPLGNMMMLGVGWFGLLFFWGFYTGIMPLFLSRFTDSKFTISLVLTLAGISGCVVPPIVGYLSDRTATRYGRRKPYIFFGMLSMAFWFALLPHMRLFAAVIAVSAIIYISVDVAQTPYMSLLPDLIPARRRGAASGIMNFFGNVGLIGCFFLSSRLWEQYPVALFYVISGISLGCTLAAIAALREPPLSQILLPERTSPLAYLRGIAEQKNAVKFFLAQFFWWSGFWIIQPFITLFAVEQLGIAEDNAITVPLTAGIVQTISVLPLGILGDRVGRKKLLAVMIAFWAAAELSIGASRNMAQLLFLAGLTGIPLAAVTGIGYAFLLDLIPQKRTAEFVGLGIISMAAPQVFGPLIGGALIDSLGYPFIFPIAAIFTLIALILTLAIPAAGKHALPDQPAENMMISQQERCRPQH